MRSTSSIAVFVLLAGAGGARGQRGEPKPLASEPLVLIESFFRSIVEFDGGLALSIEHHEGPETWSQHAEIDGNTVDSYYTVHITENRATMKINMLFGRQDSDAFLVSASGGASGCGNDGIRFLSTRNVFVKIRAKCRQVDRRLSGLAPDALLLRLCFSDLIDSSRDSFSAHNTYRATGKAMLCANHIGEMYYEFGTLFQEIVEPELTACELNIEVFPAPKTRECPDIPG